MSEPKLIKIESHKREEGGFLYEPPKECCNCGRNLHEKEWPENGLGPYLAIHLSIPGIALYQCLRCGAIMGNIHAAANIKKIKEEQATLRVMRPDKQIILAS